MTAVPAMGRDAVPSRGEAFSSQEVAAALHSGMKRLRDGLAASSGGARAGRRASGACRVVQLSAWAHAATVLAYANTTMQVLSILDGTASGWPGAEARSK